ncbi:integrase arm-type DNA-binding domain-containing protein [Roseisolibacter sp. H3M3-2]|uniref:tyrosine-type recombinase/integrase n=1 Tax=Roseisolibacter sp. H3M3-2 TaxID=3031323 RepID=UPI0023DC99B6|nr:integrase arm-type DNA-binding domain-containing protein [Roseisolibacter sp. H3M3-2]MDF1505785.1 integrase arm-type DNA-binding domain-containing protein [Roseisolibacter sp. H3M3-2]
MLTNATVKAARPRARPYKVSDGTGLFLFVQPTGRKSWRLRYRVEGREQLRVLGAWPEVDIGDARAQRDRWLELLGRGVGARAANDADDSFTAIARRWYQHQRERWSEQHAADVITSLERDVFPAIGAKPIGDIDAPMILRAVRAIERRGSIETARRIRQRISAVFGFAMSEGLCEDDPAAIVTKALAPAPASRRQPALTDIDAVRDLIAAVDRSDAGELVKLASRFLALTAVRLACVRQLPWSELEDLDEPAPLWRIPAARMKLKKARKTDPTAEHLVPLSSQAVEVLRRARALGGAGPLVFPGRAADRPMGEGRLGELYDDAGFAGRHVPHGWRASFSTIANELKLADRALIDMALAHAPKNRVEAAYNRAQLLEERRRLFQAWADLLMPA